MLDDVAVATVTTNGSFIHDDRGAGQVRQSTLDVDFLWTLRMFLGDL